MMLKKVDKIVFIAGGLLGVFSTILFKKIFKVTLSNNVSVELNPFDLIVLVVNIFLAIYITRTLGRKIDLEKNEKQYLIGYLQEFRSEFSNEVQKLLDAENFDSDIAKVKFKYLRKKNSLIIALLRDNNILNDDDPDAMNLKPKIALIWHYFTNEEDTYTVRTQQINSLRNDIEEIIFKIIFKVNSK